MENKMIKKIFLIFKILKSNKFLKIFHEKPLKEKFEIFQELTKAPGNLEKLENLRVSICKNVKQVHLYQNPGNFPFFAFIISRNFEL